MQSASLRHAARVTAARPSLVARRTVVARAAAKMADEFTEATKISFLLDASANGCTGMYWRRTPNMNDSVGAPDWPRNGAQLKGWKSQAHPGWVKVDHPEGYWMPIEQHGKPVVHFK